jgi:hypothetical protein
MCRWSSTRPGRLAPNSLYSPPNCRATDLRPSWPPRGVARDPDPPEVWEGELRVVCFVKATLDPDIAADSMLTDVGWSWLLEALDTRGAGRCALWNGYAFEFGGFRRAAQAATMARLVRAWWTPAISGPRCTHARLERLGGHRHGLPRFHRRHPPRPSLTLI